MIRGKIEWDTVMGRALYDQDKSPREISVACKVSRDAVIGYAKRHWPPREIDKVRHAGGFKRAAAPKKPPRVTGKTSTAEKVKPKPPEEPPKPPLLRGKTTLPPLPSLTYLD